MNLQGQNRYQINLCRSCQLNNPISLMNHRAGSNRLQNSFDIYPRIDLSCACLLSATSCESLAQDERTLSLWLVKSLPKTILNHLLNHPILILMHGRLKFIFFIKVKPNLQSFQFFSLHFYNFFVLNFLYRPPQTAQNNLRKQLQTYINKNNIQIPFSLSGNLQSICCILLFIKILIAQFLFSQYIFIFQLQKQTYQQQSTMKTKAVLLVLTILMCANAQEAEIIDFTYTHVLQQGGSSSQLADKIVIFPDTKQIQKHSFPEICDLKDKLDEGMDQSNLATNSIDVDEHLKGLRSKILQLLRLLEEMKYLKTALTEIEEEYDLETEAFNSTHFTSDLKRLAQKQLQLSALRKQIEQSTLKLNNLIEQYNLSPKSQQFNEINLRYKISFANSKINFYSNLKNAITKKKSQIGAPINYTQYFSELKSHFDHVNDHLDDIDNAISNYATKKLLEEKIASCKNKIQIEKLLLNEKIDCSNSKTKIKNHNHLNEEIKKTFADLREKKKEFAGMNNTQCQGVAKKLEEKIKSELKITNRAFICSQGLEATQKNLKDKQDELKKIIDQLQALELRDLEVYQRNYNKTISDISKEFQVMKKFNVDEFIHSQAEIQKLLQGAIKQKLNAEAELKGLPDGSSGKNISIKDLQRLVQQIKKEKAKYCKQFSIYQQDSRDVWSKIYQTQKKQRQLAHLRSQYITYSEKFIILESEYKQISKEVIKYLELHGQQQ